MHSPLALMLPFDRTTGRETLRVIPVRGIRRFLAGQCLKGRMLVFSNERRWPAASHSTPQAKSYYRISYISRLPIRNVNCLSPLTSILIVWKAPLGPWFALGAFFLLRRAYVNIGFATDRKILVFEHLKQFPAYLNWWDSQQARNEGVFAH